MATKSEIWGSLLRSKQPIWATSDIEKIVSNLNSKNISGSLKQTKLRANKIIPSQELEDPLFTDRNIRKYGTDIYFFDAIDDETQLILEQMLRECVVDFLGDHIQEIISQTLTDTITIHLNSPGGYAYCGLALYDFIKKLQVPITCIVEGTCASAATLILLACEERDMTDNSVYLMHQCTWGCYGTNRLMQDEAENSRKLMSSLRAIYMNETNIGTDIKDKNQREAYIQSILEHDRYFSKDECLKFGILKSNTEENAPLSDESMSKLNEFAQKLFEQEQKGKSKSTSKPKTAKKAIKK